MYFLCSGIPWRISHCVFSGLLSFAWSVTISHSVFVFHELDRVLYRISVNLDLSGGFFIFRWGLWVLGEGYIEVKCFSQHITPGGTWYPHDLSITDDVNLIPWLRESQPGFFTVKLLCLPFHALFLESKSPSSAHT